MNKVRVKEILGIRVNPADFAEDFDSIYYQRDDGGRWRVFGDEECLSLHDSEEEAISQIAALTPLTWSTAPEAQS